MVNSRLLLGFAVLLLAACHGDSAGTPAADVTLHLKPPPPAKHGPTPEELTAGMVEAVTMGKSTVPVAVKFDLPLRPTAGQPGEIVIAVMPQIAADPATLMVTGSDVLVLAQGGGPIEIPAVEPGQVYRHNVQLTPTTEGVQFLGLSVSLKHDQTTETREFSIPIIVAPAGAGAPGDQGAGLKAP